MTFLQMQTEVFRRLDEDYSTPATSPIVWTLAQVKAALNDGYAEISDATEWREQSATVSLTTATYYDLSDTSVIGSTNVFLAPRAIFNSQTNRWLRESNDRELDGAYAQWEKNTGAPEAYIMRGLWKLGVWPKSSAASGSVVLYFVGLPVDLSADGDTPSFPQEFHYGLVEYAIYSLLCEDAEIELALDHWKQYQGYEAGLGQWVRGRITNDRMDNIGSSYGR